MTTPVEFNRLFHAAVTGNVQDVHRILVTIKRFGLGDVDVANTATDSWGMTCLHFACIYGHFPLVRYLLEEAKVQIDKRTNWGATPLHEACARNDPALVGYLIETWGASLEVQEKHGKTPLHVASSYGHLDVVRYLVEQQGANINARRVDDGRNTPMDDAFGNGRDDIVRYLLPSTLSASTRTLVKMWKHDHYDRYDDNIRRTLLEKYALGCGFEHEYRQRPLHTIFEKEFPLPSIKAFQNVINNLIPSSYHLSILDDKGRLSIHVALSCNNNELIQTPAVILALFNQEPRLALVRDPMTGLFPHETVASFVAVKNNQDDDDEEKKYDWLDVSYKLFHANPLYLIQARQRQQQQRRSL